MKLSSLHSLKFVLLAWALPLFCWAQSPHQVINSAGQDRVSPSGTLILTDNVGETIIQTVPGGTNIITQGFLQTFNILPGVNLEVLTSPVTCAGRKDGRISTSLSNTLPTYTISYIWSDTTLCSTNNCSSLDSLGAMSVSLTVVVIRPIGAGNVLIDTITRGPIVILDDNPPCDVTVYTGITANNDNVNDYFYVKDIETYPDNRVSIYNRWGNLLFDRNGYNNTTIRWPEEDALRTLTSGTYFYVLELGNGGKALKGWIELVKN